MIKTFNCLDCGKILGISTNRKSIIRRPKRCHKCAGKIHSIFMSGRVPWNKNKKGIQIAWNKGIGKPKPNCIKCGTILNDNRSKVCVKHIDHSMLIGRHASKETRQKQSISQKNPSLELRKRRSEFNRGAKSYLWKGGITPLVKMIRTSMEMRMWRTAVFKRDNYLCTIGGKEHGDKLAADHVISFSELMESEGIKTLEQAKKSITLWDLLNGQTLCVACHKLTSTFGTKGRYKLPYCGIIKT